MKTKIEVEGMHCKSCEMLLKDSLEEIKGVKKAKANRMKKEIEVEYDESQVTIAAIKLAIMKEGYDVK
ncbi:MAG: heavy-metal-associated domain-containing protein [Candidatus Nanoarchaeia archaeon]